MSDFHKWMENETARLNNAMTAKAPSKAFVDMNTLHEILTAAIEDMEQVIKLPTTQFDLGGTWFDRHMDDEVSTKPVEVCTVCLAGAVMMNRLELPTDDDSGSELTPDDYDDDVGNRLEALNCLRSGDIKGAWCYLYKDDYENIPDIVSELPTYWDGEIPSTYYAATSKEDVTELLVYLRKMRDELKEAGI